MTARSCSEYRSHSAAASDILTPVRAMPGNVPRRASSNVARSQSSAVRLVKWPAGGRPRPDHAGPISFWTCRPDGRRYFAYQTGPRLRSTRKTCPVTHCMPPNPTPISGHIWDTLALAAEQQRIAPDLQPRRGEGIEPSKPGAARPCQF